MISQMVRLITLFFAFICLTTIPYTPVQAQGSVHTVNTLVDNSDAVVGDGLCDISSVQAGNQCTLRAAIQEANASSTGAAITFSVTGTITLTRTLPTLMTNIFIDGPGNKMLTLELDPNSSTRIFHVAYDIMIGETYVTIDGITLKGGSGAILNESNLTIKDSIITESRSRFAAAIANAHNLRIERSRITNNHSENIGGGIYSIGYTLEIIDSVIDGNYAGDEGGGIWSSDTIIIRNTTISNNTAGERAGGGIKMQSGSSQIINSTFSGNVASKNSAIDLDSSTVQFHNVTINSSTTAPTLEADYSRLTMTNSIIANNLGPACEIVSETTFTNSGGNVATDASCGSTFKAVSPQALNLLPLGDNGGLAFTHALPLDSAAVNAGDNSLIPPGITTDQRGTGYARVFSGTVDIGAFELQDTVPTPTPTPIFTPTDTPTVTPSPTTRISSAMARSTAAPISGSSIRVLSIRSTTACWSFTPTPRR
jgi:CSLREA domain-containing protein